MARLPMRARDSVMRAARRWWLSAETHAEFKQVTVLFADVVHSMHIAAARGCRAVARDHDRAGRTGRRRWCSLRRHGGKFTGDGIMAVFGAPVTSGVSRVSRVSGGLGHSSDALRLAAEVQRRDGVDLRLRVGLNSGQVIAGEIGSGASGYTAIGEQVGLAQRMESVAPPGAVMLSESTAHLVEHAAVLDDPELVRIKGARQSGSRAAAAGDRAARMPWPAAPIRRLVGRRSETATIDRHPRPVDRWSRWCGGGGGTAGHRQEPGGAGGRGAGGPSWGCGVLDLLRVLRQRHPIPRGDAAAARGERDRATLTARPHGCGCGRNFPAADSQDLLLLDHLLGIADPDVLLPRSTRMLGGAG